jgi:hypothetical protein
VADRPQGKPKRLEILIINDEADAPSFLNPMSGQIFVTNRVGKKIMQLADGNLEVEAIVDEVTREFKGVAREVAVRDTDAFLAASTEKGLITWIHP